MLRGLGFILAILLSALFLLSTIHEHGQVGPTLKVFLMAVFTLLFLVAGILIIQ